MVGFSKLYRFDNNKRWGGVIHIRDPNPSKILEKHSCQSDIKCVFFKFNLRKCKWLLCGMYHPPSQNDEYCFNYLDKALDT